jgi:hypothetical protein
VTITEFLTARLADDERACGGGDDPESWCDRATGVHLGPDRALAELEAKRRIIELHPEMLEWCVECAHESHPCRTLRALALPFADHPDYDEAWRP